MYKVDARGLSCPEPVMLAMEAIKSNKMPFVVLVSEVNQKANIEKLARKNKRTTKVTEVGTEFEIVVE